MMREALRVEIINEGPVQSRDPLPVIRFGSDNEHCLHKSDDHLYKSEQKTDRLTLSRHSDML